MAFPASPTPGQQVEEPVGSGNWFEYDPNLIAPGIGGWKSIPAPAPTGDRFQNTYPSALTHAVGHNLNQRPVSVQCIDGAGNNVIPDVDHTSVNVVTLHWSEAIAPTVVVRR